MTVYLVTMKGQFKSAASGPAVPGHRPHSITGDYLSLVVSARSFLGTDFGLGPEPPPVAPASLGPVTWLKR